MPQGDYTVVNLGDNPRITTDQEKSYHECNNNHIHINPAPKITVFYTRSQSGLIEYLPDGLDGNVSENWIKLSPHLKLPENTYFDFEVTHRLEVISSNIQDINNNIAGIGLELNFNGSVLDYISRLRKINNDIKLAYDDIRFCIKNLTALYGLIAENKAEVNQELLLNRFTVDLKTSADGLKQFISVLDSRIIEVEENLQKHVFSSFHLSKSIGICETKLSKLKELKDHALNENKNTYLESTNIYHKRARQINLKFRQDIQSIVIEKFKEKKGSGIIGSVERFFSYKIQYFYNWFTHTEDALNDAVDVITAKLIQSMGNEESLVGELERLKESSEKFNGKVKELNICSKSLSVANKIYSHVLSKREDHPCNQRSIFFNILARNPTLAYNPSLIDDLPNIFTNFIRMPWLNLDIDDKNILGLSRAYTLTHVTQEIKKVIEQFKSVDRKREILQGNYTLRKVIESAYATGTQRIKNIVIGVTILFTVVSALLLASRINQAVITKKKDNDTKWYHDATIWLGFIASLISIFRTIFLTIFDLRLISIAEKTQINKLEEDKHLKQIEVYENEIDIKARVFIKNRQSIGRDFQLLVDYFLLNSPGGNEILPSLTIESFKATPLFYIKNLSKYINSRDFYASILHGNLPLENVESAQLYKPVFDTHQSLFYQLYQKKINFFQELILADGRTVILLDNSFKIAKLFKQHGPTYHDIKQDLTTNLSWLFFEVFSFVSSRAKSVDIYRRSGAIRIDDDKFKHEVHSHTKQELFEDEINLKPILTEVLLYFLHMPGGVEYIADIIIPIKNKYGKTVAKLSSNGKLLHLDSGYNIKLNSIGQVISVHAQDKIVWEKPITRQPVIPEDIRKKVSEMLEGGMIARSQSEVPIPPPPPLLTLRPAFDAIRHDAFLRQSLMSYSPDPLRP